MRRGRIGSGSGPATSASLEGGPGHRVEALEGADVHPTLGQGVEVTVDDERALDLRGRGLTGPAPVALVGREDGCGGSGLIGGWVDELGFGIGRVGVGLLGWDRHWLFFVDDAVFAELGCRVGDPPDLGQGAFGVDIDHHCRRAVLIDARLGVVRPPADRDDGVAFPVGERLGIPRDRGARTPFDLAVEPGEAIEVQLFEYAVGPRSFLTVSDADLSTKDQLSADFLLTYLTDPYTIFNYDQETGERLDTRTEVVQSLLAGEISGAYGLSNRLQVGAALPLVLSISGQGLDPETGNVAADGLQATGLGDMRLEAKYLIRRLEENKDTYLSSEQLFSSFRLAVINNSDAIPQYGEIEKVGDEGGDFIFLKK